LDDRISLYNYLFPGTKYELSGFTDNPYDADYVSFVVLQEHPPAPFKGGVLDCHLLLFENAFS
jgi:hypothetical protein